MSGARVRNFVSVSYDVSLEQAWAIEAFVIMSSQLAQLGKLSKAHLAALLEIQLKGLANGDKGVEAKLLRALTYILLNLSEILGEDK